MNVLVLPKRSDSRAVRRAQHIGRASHNLRATTRWLRCALLVATAPRVAQSWVAMVRTTRAQAGASFEMSAEKPRQLKKKGAAADTETESAPKRRKVSKKDAVEDIAPAGWRPTYDLIVELRKDRTAVVDSMGSEAIAAQASAADRAYQTLVSLMLSSQTKDTVNLTTMQKLRAHPDGLSVQSVLSWPDETLHEMIKQVTDSCRPCVQWRLCGMRACERGWMRGAQRGWRRARFGTLAPSVLFSPA